MEICRSRFIAHVLTNVADAGLYMNVSGIIAIIHFSMAHASYATAYFDVINTGHFYGNSHVCYYYLICVILYYIYIVENKEPVRIRSKRLW